MTKPLPKKVYEHVNNNTAFNMFGLINLSILKASTGTRLSSVDLKKRIRARFAKEIVGNRIEFIGK